MFEANYILLYVDNLSKSAEFYAELLGKKPIELHPTFAMFIFDSGVKLGLWARHTVEPAAAITGGGGEIAFALTSRAAVDAKYSDWSSRGLSIAQLPTEMDFGYTFVALDPDSHRLRVFAPSAE